MRPQEETLVLFHVKHFCFLSARKIFVLLCVEVSEEGGERTERNCFMCLKDRRITGPLKCLLPKKKQIRWHNED